MRHFLILATAIAGLTVGMIAAADCGALMPGTGPAQTLPSRQSGTAAVAVDLIALAATADQRQLAAALTAIPTQRGSFAGLAILLARRGGSRRPTVAGCRSESHGLSMGNLPATRTVSTPGPSRCFSLRRCSTRSDGWFPASATPHRSAARRTVSGWTIACSRRHAWIRTGCRHFVRHPQRQSRRICSTRPHFLAGADSRRHSRRRISLPRCAGRSISSSVMRDSCP